MILATEEKKSHASLIVFIDLLFLLVAFFTLLLFFVQSRSAISEKELESVEESLARITGEEANIPQALKQLESMLDKFMAEQNLEADRQQKLAEKENRRRKRKFIKLKYLLSSGGAIIHKNKRYTLENFRARVVTPLRGKYWISFEAYADKNTPFGDVIQSRRELLKDSNEFDSYWDNVTRRNQAAEQPP